MNNIIRRVADSIVYLTAGIGFEREPILKIGSSEHEESREKSYKASGNLSGWLCKKSGWDEIEEFVSQVYYQDKKYDKYKKKKHVLDYFYQSSELESNFKDLELNKLYYNIFSDFTEYGKCFEYLIGNSSLLDVIGAYDVREKKLDYWLRSEPRTEKSASFWRMIIYSCGNDYDSIVNHISETKYSNKALNYLKNKLENLQKTIEISCKNNKSNVDKVKNLYLTYCSTMNVNIRKEVEKEIYGIINNNVRF